MTKHERKVWIFGLDSGDFRIIDPLIQAGRLPNLARLIDHGVRSSLISVIPPISPSAWVTLLTGVNPGKHGVLGFRNYDLSKYSGHSQVYTTSQCYRGRSLLEMASRAGKKVCAVAVPMTYPPFPVNGFLLSGFPRPYEAEPPVYPKREAANLGRWNVEGDPSDRHLPIDKKIAVEEYWLNRHHEIALAKLGQPGWDLFFYVMSNTDHIGHFFWRLHDTSSPEYDAELARRYGDQLARHYELADRNIGDILNLADENTTVFVLSDHGTGAYPTRYFHFNSWLRSQGMLKAQDSSQRQRLLSKSLLTLRRRVLPRGVVDSIRNLLGRGLSEQLFSISKNTSLIDWRSTQAYAITVFEFLVGIHINLQGRQPAGVVEPHEYETLRADLIHRLKSIEDPETGSLVVDKAFRREDLYSGGYVGDFFDIFVLLNRQYKGGDRLDVLSSPVERTALRNWSGTHRMTGILIAYGHGVRQGEEIGPCRLLDMTPTILYAAGLPIPGYMDGHVITSLFSSSFVRQTPILESSEEGDSYSTQLSHDEPLSEAEKRSLEDHLRSLGYIE
jgi:predicted AlkP superfamily phosphohydrolase/phosphomutase